MGNNVWSDEHTDIARRMLAAGARNHEFIAAINRSKAAARCRVLYVDNPTNRDYAAERARRYRESPEYRATVRRREVHVGIVPHEVAADAVARADAPRTITAWLQGDPPPGFSALDRREQRA